ncbi:hypothetical protein [Nocardioides sp. GXZ039]|uniref:hypothetical protein n=1 Tax=Nocardioides sp. GXZ039 TaxID=3136018 RepID=UPI0030F4528E
MILMPAAHAAPATNNLYPTIGGPRGELEPRCTDDPEGGDGRVTCITDDATVYWYMDSGGPDELERPDRIAVRAAINNEFEPTHLDMVYDSTPVFSGEGETDIYYQESSSHIDAGADAVTWCDDAQDHTRFKCDQQYVRMRPGSITQGLACHETGHAIGLVHGRQATPPLDNNDLRLGCLTTPVRTSDLGSTNTQNINNHWDAP